MWMLLSACTAPDTAKVDPVDSALPTDTGTVVTVPRMPLQVRWPLTDEALFTSIVGVDHDPDVYEGIEKAICLDYASRPFPWCYDEHDGSDFILDGSFDTMDAGSTPIVAAADGVVVDAHDGEYDRCHATTDGIDCDGNSGVANYVIVEHEDGWRTKYWHMKQDSVTVAVGDPVTCGDPLGLVGSSGYSSAPHLHFEIEDAEGTVWDSYAGELSQPETFWVDQRGLEELPGQACAGG